MPIFRDSLFEMKAMTMDHWKVFLGGAFLTAAALAALAPMILTSLSAVFGGAVLAARVGGGLEVLASLLGGLLATRLSYRGRH
jgi:hypothetical protein